MKHVLFESGKYRWLDWTNLDRPPAECNPELATHLVLWIQRIR